MITKWAPLHCWVDKQKLTFCLIGGSSRRTHCPGVIRMIFRPASIIRTVTLFCTLLLVIICVLLICWPWWQQFNWQHHHGIGFYQPHHFGDIWPAICYNYFHANQDNPTFLLSRGYSNTIWSVIVNPFSCNFNRSSHCYSTVFFHLLHFPFLWV